VVHFIGESGPAQQFATELIEPIAGEAVRGLPVSPVVGLDVGLRLAGDLTEFQQAGAELPQLPAAPGAARPPSKDPSVATPGAPAGRGSWVTKSLSLS